MSSGWTLSRLTTGDAVGLPLINFIEYMSSMGVGIRQNKLGYTSHLIIKKVQFFNSLDWSDIKSSLDLEKATNKILTTLHAILIIKVKQYTTQLTQQTT